MTIHVFTQTTNVVAALHGFTLVVIPIYIQRFIEIRQRVSEPQEWEFSHFHHFGYRL